MIFDSDRQSARVSRQNIFSSDKKLCVISYVDNYSDIRYRFKRSARKTLFIVILENKRKNQPQFGVPTERGTASRL